MRKILKQKYKTFDGAAKRAAFENAIAKSEFERGHKAKLYRYFVIPDHDNNCFRIARAVMP